MSHTDGSPRIAWSSFEQTAPSVIAALRSIASACKGVGLEDSLIELTKIRASQINRCAYCIQFHLNVARRNGVPAAKLDLLPAWREAGIYTEREKAALEWTEVLTRAAEELDSGAAFARLGEHFSTEEIVFLTSSIGLINAWNRIAGGLQFTPLIPAQG